MADGHSGVGHGLHVRSTTGLLVGDRCCADGCRDGHLALAEVRQPGLQLGDGLVACQARKIHRANVHARQNAVAVGAGEGEGDRREKEQCRDGADDERNYETDEAEMATGFRFGLDPRQPRREPPPAPRRKAAVHQFRFRSDPHSRHRRRCFERCGVLAAGLERLDGGGHPVPFTTRNAPPAVKSAPVRLTTLPNRVVWATGLGV